MGKQGVDSTTRTSRVLLAIAFVLASARLLAGDGLERVTYRITYADGRTELRVAATERQTDGAYRARFRMIDMTDDMKWIDVVFARYDLPRIEFRPYEDAVVDFYPLAYATESIFLRCKFGRCDRRTSPKSSWETNMPPVVVDYTFADFRQIMRDCRDNGIDKADMRDLGLNGLVHVDAMSARHPERCHDPRHPNNAAQECEWLRKIARKARAAFGGYSSECGCDHFASDLDNILYQASYPGWGIPVTSLVDGYLPTWSIVYNGIIMSTPFYATLDAGVPREPGGKSDAVGKNRAVFEFLGSPQRTRGAA